MKSFFTVVLISIASLCWAQTTIDADKDLFYSIFDDHVNGVRKALQQGADVKATYTYERYAQECQGWRPVHAASAMGNPKVLELLLEKGAKLDTPLPQNHTGEEFYTGSDQPLHLAAAYGNEDMVEFLLKKGVAIDVRGKWQQTPLINAIRSNSPKGLKVAMFLLDEGAAPAAKDAWQMTPLFYAAQFGKKKLVQFLLEKGVEVNAQSTYCAPDTAYAVTPIFCAIAHEHNTLLPLLLKHGAQLNTPNLGSTPLHQAVAYDNVLAANFLIEHGALREAQDGKGRMPLNIALEKGNNSMIYLLRKGELPPSEQQLINLLESGAFDKFNKKHYPCPAFTVKGFNGKKISEEDLKGKVTLLNIWATWCGPCLKEIPDLQKLKEEVKRDDFQIIAVSIDDLRRTVARFVNKNNFDFTYAFDPTAEIREVLGGTMPTSFIINKKGEIIAQVNGRADWDRKVIRELLRVLTDAE